MYEHEEKEKEVPLDIVKKSNEELMKQFQRSSLDVGSSEVQIALLTKRIQTLSEHFKKYKKDEHSRYGLIKLVNRRRKLLSYLRRKNFSTYSSLLKALNLRGK